MVKENSIYEKNKTLKQVKINETVAFAVFFILAFLSGTRIAVGNDFWVYRNNFELIAQSRVVSSEFGFNLIVRIVQWFAGYDNYMPIFFVFSAITAYFFVKALYDESDWFAASLFLLLTNGFYFSSLNTVRYYLAFAMALYAIKFVLSGRHLEFITLIVLAATIHMTVLIVIPIYYLANLEYKKWHIALVAAATAALVILREPIRKVAFIIYPYYDGSYLDDFDISYTNILKAAAVLVFSLIFYKSIIKDDKKLRFYFNLNVGALIVFSCLWYLPESTRIGYYLSASNIFLIPAVLKRIGNRKTKIFFTVAIALAYAVFFVFYLRTLDATDIRILPYRNWFFAR
jgi:hypothetical protein